jgi:PKD domain-containing protein
MLLRAVLAALAALVVSAPTAVAAPTWLAPVDLGAEVTMTSSIGKVAVAPDGRTVAAWSQATADGSSFDVQVRSRPPGGDFGPVVTIPGTSGAGSVDVGVDGAGNATVTWEQAGSIRAVRVPAGGAPGMPQTIAGTGAQPVVAVGRSGAAVVAWIQDQGGFAPVVRAAVRPGASGDFVDVKTISGPSFAFGISGVMAAVGDSDAAAVAWARFDGARTLVEVNDRAPSGAFADTGTAISDLTPNFSAAGPAITIDATGRETALWEDLTRGVVQYAERPPGGDWSGFDRASRSGDVASSPSAGVAPDGTVVAAWFVSGPGSTTVVESAARAAGGGGFAGHTTLSGPGVNVGSPQVAVGRGGHALVTWLPSNGEAVFNRYRSPAGAFGPVLRAVSNQGQPAGEFRSFFAPDADVDDEGNAVAVWTRDAFRQSDTSDHYRMQLAALDAAAPTLTAVSVPPAGTVGASVGMAAAATDRWSPVAIDWSFGDGSGAAGPAVTHAFGGPGAFTVQVTATDAAGNASSAARPVLVTAPAPPAPPPSPPSTPRIDSTVQSGWGFDRGTGKKFFLYRLNVVAPPRGSAAQLRCSGKRCRFVSRRFTKMRKGDLRIYKLVKPAKAARMKARSFRAGQTVQLRITAPGYVGKVVTYKLKRGKLPVGVVRCLAPGATKPSKC